MLNSLKHMPGNSLQFFRPNILRLLSAYLFLACSASMAGEIITPAPERKNELTNLVQQDCGSCHGLRFEGGLGVPLTPEALEGKSSESLRDAILYGRNGTTMPPWNPFITEAEAAWIVQMLQKGSF